MSRSYRSTRPRPEATGHVPDQEYLFPLHGPEGRVSRPLLLLDAMIPASTAMALLVAIQPGLGFVYIPHGAVEKFRGP